MDIKLAFMNHLMIISMDVVSQRYQQPSCKSHLEKMVCDDCLAIYLELMKMLCSSRQ